VDPSHERGYGSIAFEPGCVGRHCTKADVLEKGMLKTKKIKGVYAIVKGGISIYSWFRSKCLMIYWAVQYNS